MVLKTQVGGLPLRQNAFICLYFEALKFLAFKFIVKAQDVAQIAHDGIENLLFDVISIRSVCVLMCSIPAICDAISYRL